MGPGWERVDGGGWVRRRHRASNPVDARVARALVVARERFIAPGEVGVARVPLEPGKKVLRASRLAWRAWGLGAGFSEADVEARAEETRAYAESLAGSGAPVDFERWAQAFRAVAQAHNARSHLARAMRLNADARDARECLRAFQDALGSRNEARKAERVSPEPAAALLAAARRTKQLARTRADLVVVERLLRGAANAASTASPARAEDDAARAAREAGKPQLVARRRWSSRFCCARRDATTTRASSSPPPGFGIDSLAPCCGTPRTATATPTPGRLRRRRNAAR